MRIKGPSHGEIVVIILIIGVLAAILVPALAKSREARQRRGCMNNLKQLGLILNMYGNENKDQYPPIDSAKNNFIFDADLLYPEYLNDSALAACPGNSRLDPDTNFRLTSDHSTDGTPRGQVHPDCITGDSYIYLGWQTLSDKEAEAVFKAYDKFSMDDYDADIIVSEGAGSSEGVAIQRLTSPRDCLLIILPSGALGTAPGPNTSEVPIIWDRPYTDIAEFSHRPIGGNALYHDGHVEFHRFPAPFPINETMARLLDERAREPIPHCE